MLRTVTCCCAVFIVAAGMAAPWWDQPLCGGYQNYAPSESRAQQMQDTGLTTLLYAFNSWREPASDAPDDFTPRVHDDAVAPFRAWAALALRHDLNLIPEIDIWADDEPKFFAPAKHYRRLVLASGESPAIACPRDPTYWAYLTTDTLYLAAVPGVRGAAFDTETYSAGAIYPGYAALTHQCCYCDDCWAAYRRQAQPDPGAAAPDQRYLRLADMGQLDAYGAWLELAVADRAAALRVRAQQAHPGLALGVINCLGPRDWFALGLLRGFSTPTVPALCFSENEYGTGVSAATAEMQAVLRRERLNVRYVGGLMLSSWEGSAIGAAAVQLGRQADGYWLFCANTLFVTEAQARAAKPPWDLREGTVAAYWAALTRANQLLRSPASPAPAAPSRDLLPSLRQTAAWVPQAAAFTEGFEPGTDLTKWRAYYSRPALDTTRPGTGQASVRLDGAGETPFKCPRQMGFTVPVTPGQPYRFSVRVRTDRLVHGEGAWAHAGGASAGPRLHSTHDWTELSAEFTPDQPQADVALTAHYTRGEVWFDDLRLDPIAARTLETAPVAIAPGQRLAWQADTPPGSRLTLDIVRPGSGRVLLRNASPRTDLSVVPALHGPAPVAVCVRLETWRGQWPALRFLSLR